MREERVCNESTTPPFQGLVRWFGAGPQHFPVWGSLKLCLYPLLYNDQIRHGYTHGKFLLGEGGSATVTIYCTNELRGLSATAEFLLLQSQLAFNEPVSITPVL